MLSKKCVKSPEAVFLKEAHGAHEHDNPRGQQVAVPTVGDGAPGLHHVRCGVTTAWV